MPAQESFYRDRATTANPTFELAYWAWALRVAQRRRPMPGLAENLLWTDAPMRPGLPSDHFPSDRFPSGTWTVRHEGLLPAP